MRMRKIIAGVVGAIVLAGLAPVAVQAADDATALTVRISIAIERAQRTGQPILPAVNQAIAVSGSEPEVVADAIDRLVSRCPRPDVLAALSEQQRRRFPVWCNTETINGLTSIRTVALAQASDATGATGAVSGGIGLPGAGAGASNGVAAESPTLPRN